MSSVGEPTAVETPVAKDSARGDALVREISIAHSPDSDDAFMFYALATNKVRVPGLRFTHTTSFRNHHPRSIRREPTR